MWILWERFLKNNSIRETKEPVSPEIPDIDGSEEDPDNDHILISKSYKKKKKKKGKKSKFYQIF